MSQEQTTTTQTRPGNDVASEASALSAPMSVLVADDNLLNGLLLSEQLRLLGLSAEIATSGRDALQRWRGGAFDVILTDIQMPEMDGYELASAIRREEGDRRRIPIIALTANAFLDKPARWKAVGIDDYLTKPAELSALKATLNHWLQRLDAGKAIAAAERAGDEPGAPVDPKALSLMIGTDPAVHSEFLAAFARSASESDAAIAATMQLGDHARTGFLGHQLKASAAAVGAARLAEICGAMEAAARDDDVDALVAWWQLFGVEVRLVETWIATRIAQVAADATRGRR